MDIDRALADVDLTPFWLQDESRPDAAAPLDGTGACDLAVIGGGYSGLWAALLAKERDPSLDVVVLEAGRVGGAASGRNGGFCAASLTHGLENGAGRWPDDMPALERLGRDNLGAIGDTLAKYGIDAEWELTGEMDVATEEWQVPGLEEAAGKAAEFGWEPVLLDRDAVRAEVDSPTYHAGLWNPVSTAMVHPAKLAWGLRTRAVHLVSASTRRAPSRVCARRGASSAW